MNTQGSAREPPGGGFREGNRAEQRQGGSWADAGQTQKAGGLCITHSAGRVQAEPVSFNNGTRKLIKDTFSVPVGYPSCAGIDLELVLSCAVNKFSLIAQTAVVQILFHFAEGNIGDV